VISVKAALFVELYISSNREAASGFDIKSPPLLYKRQVSRKKFQQNEKNGEENHPAWQQKSGGKFINLFSTAPKMKSFL